MKSIVHLFASLSEAIAQHNREQNLSPKNAWHHQLTVTEHGDCVDVEYQGEYEVWFDNRPAVLFLNDLCELLARGPVARRLHSFTFRTAAALAANGTYDFNIDPLVDGNTRFPNLTRLHLDQGEGEHGYKILTSPSSGDNWHEAGVLARLLSKAPRLAKLVSPVPPNADFFRGRRHPLQSLNVDAGFGHADFIRHLAECKRFPELRHVVFTDYRQTYMTEWRSLTTSFEHYDLFFRSPLVEQLESIHLCDVSLTSQEIRRLRAIRSEGVKITRCKG